MKSSFAAAVLATCLSLTHASGQVPSRSIRPGKALGPFDIGMRIDTAQALMRSFGEVKNVSDKDGQGRCNPSGSGVCVYDTNHRQAASVVSTHKFPGVVTSRTPGRVAVVSSNDKRFRTENGFGVGSSVADFIGVYGTPQFGRPPRDILAPEYQRTGLVFVDWPSAGLGLVARMPTAAAERVTLSYLKGAEVLNIAVYSVGRWATDRPLR